MFRSQTTEHLTRYPALVTFSLLPGTPLSRASGRRGLSGCVVLRGVWWTIRVSAGVPRSPAGGVLLRRARMRRRPALAGRHRTAAGFLSEGALKHLRGRRRSRRDPAPACSARPVLRPLVAALRSLHPPLCGPVHGRCVLDGCPPAMGRFGAAYCGIRKAIWKPGAWDGPGHGGLVLPCLDSTWRPPLERR
jgi:hypothetical protein